MYGSMEESPPAEAPALGPAELKAVRELLSATSKTATGDDARPAGLLHEPQELSTSTLTKLEAASDEVELQASVWDGSLFLFNPVAGRSASVFAFLRTGPRGWPPVVKLFLYRTSLFSPERHIPTLNGPTPGAAPNLLPHERAREEPRRRRRELTT